MKILIISNLFQPNQIGGYEIACRDTAILLSAENNKLCILTSRHPSCGNTQSYANADNLFEVHYKLYLHVNWNKDFPVYQLSSADKNNISIFNDMLVCFDPDLIYCWNLYGLGPSFINHVASIPSMPKVLHLMDQSLLLYEPSLKRSFNQLFNRWHATQHLKISEFTFIIYISNFLKSKFSGF